MSSQIGEVSINLRMNLVNFQKDVRDGTAAASEATKEMSSEIRGHASEARGALALMGETIGIHIPRHLQTFIAALPGVGTALNAAFSSVAVLALAGFIAEIAEKIIKFQENAAKLKEALTEAGDRGKESIEKLEMKVTELDKQFAELTGNRVEALRLSLKLINEQSLDSITGQLKEISKELDELLKKQLNAWWENLFVGDNKGVNTVKEQADSMLVVLKDLQQAGNTKGYGEALASMLSTAKTSAAGQIGQSKQVTAAWETVRMELQTLQSEYLKTSEIAKKGSEVAVVQDEKTAIEARNKSIEEFNQLKEKSNALLAKEIDPITREIQKIQDAIDKWNDYKRIWEQAHGGISAAANQQIEALQHEIELLKAEAKSAIDLAIQASHMENQRNVYNPLLSGPPSQGMPVYGGTKQAQLLYDIQHKSNTAVQEGQKIYDETRTSAERYADVIAEIDALEVKGAIDTETARRARMQAGVEFGTIAAKWQELGVSIGQTIAQTVEFGQSWTQALQNVGIQIGELILQMTLLKSLQAESSQGGIGGFFANLAEGMMGGTGTGHARGGGVDPHHMYPVGEDGPEMFVPNAYGTILPTQALRGSHDGPANQQIQIVNNFSTPDADSFKRSEKQISSRMFRDAAAAHGRYR